MPSSAFTPASKPAKLGFSAGGLLARNGPTLIVGGRYFNNNRGIKMKMHKMALLALLFGVSCGALGMGKPPMIRVGVIGGTGVTGHGCDTIDDIIGVLADIIPNSKTKVRVVYFISSVTKEDGGNAIETLLETVHITLSDKNNTADLITSKYYDKFYGSSLKFTLKPDKHYTILNGQSSYLFNIPTSAKPIGQCSHSNQKDLGSLTSPPN